MDLSKFLYTIRELYHGDVWLTDNRFFTPMITSACGDVFVDDFAHCFTMEQTVLAKINRFFSKVSNYK